MYIKSLSESDRYFAYFNVSNIKSWKYDFEDCFRNKLLSGIREILEERLVSYNGGLKKSTSDISILDKF